MTDDRPQRPSVIPLVIGAVVLALVVIGLFRVLDWVFSWTFAVLVVAVLAIFLWVRRR